ncbi:MAG: hypothetical protein ACT4OG_01790 [Alphaproteobacteria bacterium]
MRHYLASGAAAAVGIWAGAAWAADDAPSSDGARVTFAPLSALTWDAGVFDPQFRSGTFAVLAEPPATTIGFRFGNDAIGGLGILQLNTDFDPYAPVTGGPAYTLRDAAVTTALAPGVAFTLAQGRDLSSLGVFGAGNTANGLFLSSAGSGSPYLALTDGGAYAGLTVRLAESLQLRLGHATLGGEAAVRQGILSNAALDALPRDLALRLAAGRSADTSAVGVDWNFADWGAIGLTASHTSEEGGLLGGSAISIATPAETAALSVSARVGFGDGWITTVSYSEGVTQLDLRASGFTADAGTVKTRSYGVTFAKEGVFGGDTIGLSLSRPLQVYEGDPGLLGGTGLSNVNPGFASGIFGDAPESDIEFGYVTSFLGGSLALQANAAYQVNAGGQRGQNAVTVVSRAKINF